MTPIQQVELWDAKADTTYQSDGMAKWQVVFTDGHKFPYLTNDCRDKYSALLAAIERFGDKVKTVI